MLTGCCLCIGAVQTSTEWTIILVVSIIMILVLIVFRLCSPLSATYDWLVEGNEKTVDRSSAHVAAFESGTSADDVAKEHQYAIQCVTGILCLSRCQRAHRRQPPMHLQHTMTDCAHLPPC